MNIKMRLDQKTCLKQNSLDYISLLAAVNVMVAHTVAHSLAGGVTSLYGIFWPLDLQSS